MYRQKRDKRDKKQHKEYVKKFFEYLCHKWIIAKKGIMFILVKRFFRSVKSLKTGMRMNKEE
jgi:hypothetical protein